MPSIVLNALQSISLFNNPVRLVLLLSSFTDEETENREAKQLALEITALNGGLRSQTQVVCLLSLYLYLLLSSFQNNFTKGLEDTATIILELTLISY